MLPQMNMFTAKRSWLSLLVLVPASVFAQPTRELGAASFVPPAGWGADGRPTTQVYTRIVGRDRCMIAISAEEASPGTLDAAFTTAWTNIFNPNTYPRAARPRSSEQVSPAGDRHVVGEGEVEDRGGNRLVARLHVFPVGTGAQSVVLIGSSRAALDACRSDWTTFFASLRFRSVPAEPQALPGARPAPPAPEPRAPARLSEPTVQGPQQFDNIGFTPPPGWRVRRVGGLVELAPTNTRDSEALQVLLLPGRRSSAPLQSEFESGWAEVRSLLNGQQMMTVNQRPYDVEAPTRSLRATEYVRGNGPLRRADGVYGVDLYVFRAGDRVERVVVVSRDFRDNLLMQTTVNNPEYQSAVRTLLFTMKFANQPERPIASAGLRPGGIVGVWAGLGMSFGEIKTNFAIFFDNGMAYYGPKFFARGLLEIDPVVEQPAQQRYWGTYTMSGDAGVLTLPYTTIPLRRAGTALELTTNRTLHRFIRLAMPDGPLEGTWCLRSGGCLRLTAAGQFQDDGAVRVVEHSVYAFPSTPAGGQGRYTLRSHTLTLTYDSGPEIRVGFVGLPSDRRAPSPAEIRLGFEADMLVLRR